MSTSSLAKRIAVGSSFPWFASLIAGVAGTDEWTNASGVFGAKSRGGNAAVGFTQGIVYGIGDAGLITAFDKSGTAMGGARMGASIGAATGLLKGLAAKVLAGHESPWTQNNIVDYVGAMALGSAFGAGIGAAQGAAMNAFDSSQKKNTGAVGYAKRRRHRKGAGPAKKPVRRHRRARKSSK